MGIVKAVCLSEKKGGAKKDIGRGELVAQHGLKGDAHAGDWHRQISLLSLQKIKAFRAKGADVEFGAFGENLVVDGIDFSSLVVGTKFRCGGALLEMTQIGKECHNHCEIYRSMGDCIMPREGVFARVLQDGTVKVGDEFQIIGNREQTAYRVAIITVSDRCSKGEQKDASGNVVREIAESHGYKAVSYAIFPDEQALLEKELARICDEGLADLILTTGGTGFSLRDRTPEATLAVAERVVPGIPEAMRTQGMGETKRAMLSRAAAVIRNKTLIVNLPGSPKAARENLEFVINELKHGLDILTGNEGDCALH
jgi:molybdenum cofactor synthesis domain-containing protein